MLHLTACKILVSLSFLNWIKNEMIFFYRITELTLATFHFKNERLTEIYRLSGATFYACINTIHQFIKPFFDNKMSIFEEYGLFKLVILAINISFYV